MCQCLQFHGLAYFDDVARRQTACHAGDAVLGFMVRQHGSSGFVHDGLVAVDVVVVFVRIEYLGDFPTRLLGRIQAFLAV